MGWKDKLNESVEEARAQQAQTQAVAAASVAACPDPGSHYKTEVNKGSINMRVWQGHLADMYRSGYRLEHVFEQDGNTVQVYEHHGH
jgi:hypothetical protein